MLVMLLLVALLVVRSLLALVVALRATRLCGLEALRATAAAIIAVHKSPLQVGQATDAEVRELFKYGWRQVKAAGGTFGRCSIK